MCRPCEYRLSQEMKDTPNDFGAHHRWKSSGLVQASNTMRAGPLKVRVTTSSRSDLRSTVVLFFPGRITLFFCVHRSFPSVSILRQDLSSASKREAQSARYVSIHAVSSASRRGPSLQVRTRPTFSRGDEPGLFQDADMLLHAREGHVELLGKVRDRRIPCAQLFQNATPGGIRERGEGGIEEGCLILNHIVQYLTYG